MEMLSAVGVRGGVTIFHALHLLYFHVKGSSGDAEDDDECAQNFRDGGDGFLPGCRFVWSWVEQF
jgi:hypothetical protein